VGALFTSYRILHEQGFVPIFTRDGFDVREEVEACVRAGCRAIELTLRQPAVREMIPWIRKGFPKLGLFIGSTIDDEKIVRQMKRRHPQLMTLDELADLGVDGMVSVLPMRGQTIQRLAVNHLVIPAAATAGEALQQVRCGASFIKVLGPGLDLAKMLRSDATFEFCPLMMTGGMILDRIPPAVASGVMLIGAGFDVILREQDPGIKANAMVPLIKQHLQAVQTARQTFFPGLAQNADADSKGWLNALPHFHPFGAESGHVTS
jgi:2-keto-3-deoxy-6-phosphogluconate aldolase